MFKKASETKALQRLSGADRKKLRRCILERFSHASEAHIDALLPPKGEISVAKLSNRAHIFLVDGGLPMLFDVDGRGNEIYPTVFALWKVPAILPAFVLKGAEVSRYILGGADLMFPGIAVPSDGFASFSAGEVWAVRVPGNPCPIAVGATTMSLVEAVNAGFRGKALRITHYYRDTLWEAAEGRYVPNAGFLEDIVLEDPEVKLDTQTKTILSPCSSEHSTFHVEMEHVDDELETLSISKTAGGSDISVESSQLLSINSEELVGSEVHDSQIQEDSYNDEEVATSGAVVSVDEMDALLDKCLLQALHTALKDKDLPISGSTFWSGHVIACRPPGSVLDIKKSSYKKLSKWLQLKSSTGLISLKEDKHRKEVMITAINRKHSDYVAFKPDKRISGSENIAPASNDPLQSKGQLEVLEVWKPSPHVNPIFEALRTDTNKYYTFPEALDVVFAYVQKENLAKKDDENVVLLDAILCDALYKGTVKKGNTYPTEINKEDLGRTFVSRMQAHHKVTRGAESVLRKGVLKNLQIVTERRQGNKKITRVTGLESFLVDAEQLAAELQKKFACSTSVTELPGKKGQYEVLVQGGVLEDLGRHLVQQYNIPKKQIEILDKTKR